MRNVLIGKIKKEQEGQKIRDFLKNSLNLSSRNIKRLAQDRQIFINKKSVRLDYIIKENDNYSISLDRDENQDIERVKMDIDVIYEDSSILVVNKPPFMVVHPTKAHQGDTLTNGILYYFHENNDSSIVRLVSRLDMNTTGLVVIAKNQFTHSFFSRIMSENLMEKEYIAICEGIYENDKGTIREKIFKESDDSYRRVVSDLGQDSITHYEVLERLDNYSVVRFRLETGRTHQIRVHTTFLGHPIVNDELYGAKTYTINPRQFLHAYHLKFPHPMTKEIMNLECDIPKDMQDFIDSHRKK